MTGAAGLPLDELGWMELHLRCLYHHDARDRVQGARQPGGGPAPLFHVGRTRLGNLWRFGVGLPEDRVSELSRLAGRECPLPEGAPAPAPERLEAFRAVLAAAASRLVLWRGPAYRFPQRILAPDAPVVEVTVDRAELLVDGFDDWLPELSQRQPCVAALEGGRAVSLCCPSRPLEVPGSPRCPASEAGVETLASHRGRGLAAAAVAGWARATRARGGEPIYSTSWANRASLAVARKLELIAYGEDVHFSQASRSP